MRERWRILKASGRRAADVCLNDEHKVGKASHRSGARAPAETQPALQCGYQRGFVCFGSTCALDARQLNVEIYCHTSERNSFDQKTAIIGWIAFLSGFAIWLYGYFVVGHPSVINWHDISPWWVADFLPNLESEFGMLLCTAAMVPMYWPSPRD